MSAKNNDDFLVFKAFDIHGTHDVWNEYQSLPNKR